MAPIWIGLAFAARRRVPSRAQLATLALAGLIAAVPLAALAWPTVRVLRELGVEKPLAPGADLAAFVLRPGAEAAGEPEVPHFLGHVALALAAIGSVTGLRAREPRVRAASLCGLAALLLGVALAAGPSLRVAGQPLGPGPFALLHALVPAARGMASPERFTALARLGTALLAGLGAATLLGRARARAAGLIALAVVLPLEQWTPPRRFVAVPAPAEAAGLGAWLAAPSGEPLIDLPVFGDERLRYRALDLLLSTRHWRPIPIGRTSFYPPAHDALAWGLRDFPDPAALELLDRLGVRTLVVHPLRWNLAERAARMAAVDAEPRLRLGRSFDEAVPERLRDLRLGAERVFALLPAPRGPAACQPAGELPRAGWTLAASAPGAGAVTDGDPGSVWRTPRRQLPGDRLRARLPESSVLAAVVLERRVAAEFGRDLALGVEGDDGSWQRVAWADGPAERWDEVAALLEEPRRPRQVLRFSPRLARAVRLVVGGDPALPATANGWPPWSASELRLYSACR